MSATTVQIRAGDERLSVRRLGEGPRLVALHGGPGLDHHTLLPLAAPLVARFEVWLPDLPGHGASPPEEGERPGLREVLDSLDRWLAALPGEIDLLVGHSLGAWLAVELLRRGTRRPGAAVLLSPPAAGQSRAASAMRRRAETAPIFRRRETRDDPQAKALAELWAHVTAEAAGAPPIEYLKTVRVGRIRPTLEYVTLLRELHRALLAPASGFDPGCPVLVLAGELDRTTPPEQAAQVARAVAGSRIAILPGCGHYPFVDSPSATAGAILQFLGRL